MNTLVIFTSTYGNTQKIAEAIAEACGMGARALNAEHASPEILRGIQLLVAGSPTQGGRPTQAMQRFLAAIPPNGLRSVRVAAFDTRFNIQEQGLFLRIVMKTVNYAAGRIGLALTSKGGQLVAQPEGFFVLGKEGPLKEGEIERAKAWAETLLGENGASPKSLQQ